MEHDVDERRKESFKNHGPSSSVQTLERTKLAGFENYEQFGAQVVKGNTTSVRVLGEDVVGGFRLTKNLPKTLSWRLLNVSWSGQLD